MPFPESNPFGVIYAKAYAAFDLKNYDLCDSLVGEGLALEPENLDLLALGGQVKRIKQEYPLARAGAQRMIELAPNDDRGYNLLAWATLLDNNYCPSNATFNRELDDGTAAYAIRLETADALNKRCLEIDPVDSNNWLLKAKICFLRGQYDGVLEATKSGLRFSPAHYGLHHYRISAFEQKDDIPAMHAALLEQLQRMPEDDVAHKMLSQYYLSQKQVPQAIEHAREAVRLDPDDENNRESYWDAVMASNPIVRPFVQLRYAARWIKKLPQWAHVAALILLGLLMCVIFVIVEQLGDPWSGVAAAGLVILVAVIGTIFSTDRPFMAVFDIYYWYRNPTYRVSVSPQKRTETLLAVVGSIAAATVVISLNLLIFWPIALMVLAMPATCIWFANNWKLRTFTVAMTILAIALLWFGLETHQGSNARSPERVRGIQLLMGFFTTCVVTAVLTAIALKRDH